MERTCALPGCDVVVTGKRQTCSAAHRQAWSRLRKRAAKEYDKIGEGMGKPADAAQQAGAADPVELAIEVFRQELTPIVREAITDDTVKAIRALVTLHPTLIESLAKDLSNPDPVARGRAQALVAKYTLGFIDPKAESDRAPLVINLGGMPSPDGLGDGTVTSVVPEAAHDAVEVRECERCGEEKTLEHFHEDAPRCNECQAEIKAELEARYGASG